MRRPREVLRPEALPSLLLFLVVLVLAVLIIASAAQYVSVAQARTLPTLEVTTRPAFAGLDTAGNLTENGSVSLTVRLAVANPSPRALFFEQTVIKMWILDEPVQAGLSDLGRSDNLLLNATGTWNFYPAFFVPSALNFERVPAGGNGTVSLSFTLSKATAATEFEVVRNITSFARAHGVALTAIPWNVYALVSLIIDGVPAPAASASADYLRDITRDVLTQGADLGA